MLYRSLSRRTLGRGSVPIPRSLPRRSVWTGLIEAASESSTEIAAVVPEQTELLPALPSPKPPIETNAEAVDPVPTCKVCLSVRSVVPVGRAGSRTISRCSRCDVLTIADPFREPAPMEPNDRLRYSMKTFWFHLRSQLRELGHRGLIGYSGPSEYLAPLTEAARDSAVIVPIDEVASGKCSAILLFHALESVLDPPAFLASCHRMLARDGRLFVAASDARSLSCLLRQSSWSGFQLKDQLFCFSAKTLAGLLWVTGFQVERHMNSGLEVLGSTVENDLALKSKKSLRFKGLMRTIKWNAGAFHSLGSILYLEATPSHDPQMANTSLLRA